MLTIRLATAPDPKPMPGILRVELGGLGKPVELPMPSPGLATTPEPIPPPSLPTPGSFTMTIYYYLDSRRVGVVVNGVGENDSINIFASRLDTPVLPGPGVLYVGNIVHGDLHTNDCSVHCENGTPVIEECCVVCRDGNLVTETCC